ncbi:tetratricopeptide repeat-containing S1 family peptidase [Kamptonema formosum]|uniref:tetratricopeptide repeat-containing S1 family peptidase n=1 Tax=Kamptonema formosum TaxID=331992 RepID=UPI000349520D|nr:tetratricopeptide repeat protein [Oscillatoria sp. PCC 10802]
MNRNSLIWIAAFGLFLLPASAMSLGGCAPQPATLEQVAAPLSEEELQKLAASITVKVLAKNGAGSGTLIGKQNGVYTVLTNQHVLTPGQPYSIGTQDGKTHTASVVKKADFQGKDLVLLEFPAAGEYAVAALGHRRSFAVGDKVLAAGFPFDSDRLVVSAGKIEMLPDKALRGGYRIGYTNDIQQGMSGGPVLNYFGEVTGINGVSAYPILADAYRFEDGSRPSEAQLQQMNRLSWGVPVEILAEVAPERVGNIAIPPLTGIAGEVNKKAAEITVRIDGQNGNGSGVIVAKRGKTYYVLTADHVVEKEGKYQVVTPDGARVPVNYGTVKRLEGVDLAVLQFQSNETYSLATLAKYDIKEESWVFVSGWPGAKGAINPSRLFTGGLVFSKERGAINAKDSSSLTSGYELVYTNISQPGMSGGPVLDTRGRVIGINAAAEGEITYQLGYSLGVPVTTFISLAEKAGIKPEWLSVETSAPPSLNEGEIASIRAALFTLEKPASGASETDWVNYGNQLWRVFRFDEAVKAFDEAIKIKPNLYAAWYARGLALRWQDKYQEALASFDRATQIKPNLYEAWRERGNALYDLNRYPEALASFDKAIAINDKDSVLYMWRGELLQELKRYPEARDAYSQAIELKPHPLAYYSRGLACSALGDKKGAIADYTKAIELKPDFAETYYNRGNAHYALGDKQGAIIDYSKAIELKPDDAKAYYNRGNTRDDLGDKQGAIIDYSKAIELKPDDAEAYNNRGVARDDLGDKQGAIIDYSKAIELKPDDAGAYYNRGLARFNLGDKQGAIADYSKAIELKPDYAITYYNRGVARSFLGDKQGAIEDAQKAAKLFCAQGHPQCQRAQQLLKLIQQ